MKYDPDDSLIHVNAESAVKAISSDEPISSEPTKDERKYCQWMSDDKKAFFPASVTYDALTPAVYEVRCDHSRGLYFQKIPLKTEELIRFPDSNSDEIIKEIQTFWERSELYNSYGIVHKRGMLLYGPPGSGKSSTLQIIINDVINKRKGCVIKFEDPGYFIDAMRKFREIQPETPVVALMEDLDSIVSKYNRSEVLNVLDGVNHVDKVVFLATTNYPEMLEERFTNRPSRFDRRFHMPHLNAKSREIYFNHLLNGKGDLIEKYGTKIDIQQWVKDTEDMSIAHLKELFVSVAILNVPYEDKIKDLVKLNEERPSSREDENSTLGFAVASNKSRENGNSWKG